MYDSELQFEHDLIAFMATKGWSSEVLNKSSNKLMSCIRHWHLTDLSMAK